MKKVIYTLTILVITFYSCDKKPTVVFEHSDKEQVIQCDPELDPLLNEALYIFEESIKESYDAEMMMLNEAYGRYLYSGFSGTAEYDRLATKQSLIVRDALINAGVLKVGGFKSNLNYNHPVVECIISKIEEEGIRLTLQALVETNTMDPKLFNTRMRNFGNQAEKNRYEALYVALDTYYQYLIGIELTEEATGVTNE